VKSDPRQLALDVLMLTESSGAFADAALGRALQDCELGESDRHLATILVYGSLARRLTLDHTLSAYLARPLERLDLRVREVLRLGLFQIAFLDRVPAYAAVNTSVALVKQGSRDAAGLVNAVLRRATREGLAAAPDGDETERYAIELSHPRWLVQRWIAELGKDQALQLMSANNEAMPNVLRALLPRDQALEKLAEAGIAAEETRFAPDGIRAALPITIPGVVIPQGEASQLVTLLVGAAAGSRILDACASPGGKSAYLAQQVGPTGRVTAVDPSSRALARIKRLLDSAGITNVDINNCRIEDFPSESAGFDAVLVDAPCSGLGTAREHPEIRWRRSPQDIDDISVRQRSVLAAGAAHVAPGGVLVYATCTLLEQENDQVVNDFLADNPMFAEDHSLPPALGAGAELCQRGRLRTFPHRHDMAGFFAAKMRRSAD